MKKAKQERLKKAGWKVGSTKDFLSLSNEEAALIELKLVLARNLKERRLAQNWTQQGLARQLHTSQSRVAKMESADATVSIDLLIRSLLSMGATRKDLGRIIGKSAGLPAA
jgi:ribosome-binding protein aMBF1 (putative translation factor)